MAHAPLKPGDPRPPKGKLVELGLGAAWLIGTAAALQLADIALGRSPLGAAVASAVLADVGAGFAGVRWDSDERGMPAKSASDAPSAARRLGLGVAAALAVMSAALLIGAGVGWIYVEAGSPSLTLGIALVRSGALAIRDELLFRGIILLTAARAGVRPPVAAVFAALAGGAAIALTPDAGPSAVALAVTSGFLYAVLWQRFRGAWAAVGAHAFFLFLVSSGTRGGLLDVTWTQGSLAPGARSFGGPAWLAAALFMAAAVLVLRWKRLEPTFQSN